MHRKILFLLLLSTWLPLSGFATPSNLYIFGDSLSDTGNFRLMLGQSLPDLFDEIYYDGRFSNGPIYIDALATHFKLRAHPAMDNGNNYARAGAVTKNLKDQINWFSDIRGSSAPSDALYIVWIGGNDVRNAISNGLSGDSLLESISDIEEGIRRLHALGARHILVPTVPDMSLIPEFIRLAETDPEILQFASYLSHVFNNALLAMQDELESEDISTIRFDVNTLLSDIVEDQHPYEFEVIDQACIAVDILKQVFQNDLFPCDAPSLYLFWDNIHPTSTAHELIAQEMLFVIPEIERNPPTKSFFGQFDGTTLALLMILSCYLRRKQSPN